MLVITGITPVTPAVASIVPNRTNVEYCLQKLFNYEGVKKNKKNRINHLTVIK